MFARISRFAARVGDLEEGLALVRGTVATRVETQPGFEGSMVMMDRETGFGYTITFWKTEEDLAGAGSSASERPIRPRKCLTWAWRSATARWSSRRSRHSLPEAASHRPHQALPRW